MKFYDNINRDHMVILATAVMCTAIYTGGSFIGGYYLAQALVFFGGVIGGMLLESTGGK
jgi:hypothetical protein